MLATADDVKDFKVSGSVVDLSAYSDPEIEETLAVTESIIEGFVSRSFTVEEDTAKVFNGSGRRNQFFVPSYRGKISDVTEVLEIDEYGDSVYEYSLTDFVVREYFLELLLAKDSDSARRAFSGGTPGRWPAGTDNIQITATWGEEPPVAVKRAAILMALEQLKPGSSGLTASGLVAEEWEDYKVRYVQGGMQPSVDSTGFDYVDRLLDRFRVNVAMFQVVD